MLNEARFGQGLDAWSDQLVRPLVPAAEAVSESLDQLEVLVSGLPTRLVITQRQSVRDWASAVDDTRVFALSSIWKIWSLLSHSVAAWEPNPPHSFNAVAAVVEVRSAAEEAGRFLRTCSALATLMHADDDSGVRTLLAAALQSDGRRTGLSGEPSKTELVNGLTELLLESPAPLYDYLSKLAHPQGGGLDVYRSRGWVGASMVSMRPAGESPRLWWRLGYLVPASVRTGFLR